MVSSLSSKAIVITGSGGGIGAACARLAAREGAAVVVNDLGAEAVEEVVRSITSAGGVAVGAPGDVSDSARAEAVVERCVGAFGSIDGLVNNAGIMIMSEPDDLDEARARRLLEVNVLGSVFCGVAAMRRMRAQGSGAIVNVTSGAHRGIRALSIYGASKGAIASLTYGWAADLAGSGIRVNAVSPMAGTQMAADVVALQGLEPARVDAFPTAEDNAPVVMFLLSDLSERLNGQVIRIDAGEISVIGRPAIMRPSVHQDHWDTEGVDTAFASTLDAHLNPLGLLQVAGGVAHTTVKSDA